MQDTKYLFQRNRVWWVKLAVPRTLRDVLGYDLRRSLQTRDLTEAIASRGSVLEELRQQIKDTNEVQKTGRACQQVHI